MNLNDYQLRAIASTKPGSPDFDLSHAAYGLAASGGRYAEIVMDTMVHNRPLHISQAALALGEVLYFVALASSALGLTMNEIAERGLMEHDT